MFTFRGKINSQVAIYNFLLVLICIDMTLDRLAEYAVIYFIVQTTSSVLSKGYCDIQLQPSINSRNCNITSTLQSRVNPHIWRAHIRNCLCPSDPDHTQME